MTAPVWFNKQFVTKALRDSQKDDSIEVTDLVTAEATATGDNYLSDMIRATIEYSANRSGCKVITKTSLILKISPTEGTHKSAVSEVGVFSTEIRMMSTTLLKMNAMLAEADRLSPRVLHAEFGDPSFLLIEDLKPLGYSMANRCIGLNLDECILVMKGLANFHATSVKLCEKDPTLKTEYTTGLFDNCYPDDWRNHFQCGMKILANEVNKWTELGHRRQRYSERLSKLADTSFMMAIEYTQPKEGDFNVINHGDVWVNNLMFRYNAEGKATSLIFVDFQLALWTSPAVDILYFLCTSPSQEVNRHHREDLLEEYLKNLTSTMTRLGCKTEPVTMEALKKALREREMYSLLISAFILPLVLVEQKDSLGIEDMAKQNQAGTNPAYNGQLLREIMVERLSVWDSQGLLGN